MRFRLGLVVGAAVGYWAAIRTNEERRRQVEEAVQRALENPRVKRITETVSRDARRVVDAVEERVVSGADRGADAIAGTQPSGATGGTVSSEATGGSTTPDSG